MSASTLHPSTAPEETYLVTCASGGREVFLGTAVGAADEGRLTLEGKLLSITPDGRLVVRPFPTTITVSQAEEGASVHRVTTPAVLEEASRLLELTATHLHQGASPRVYAWVEAALEPSRTNGARDTEPPLSGGRSATQPVGGTEPLSTFFQAFFATSEEFRRVLYRTRQVESTRELDQVSDLEGDLLIEIGKSTNLAAVKLNRILQRERSLAAHLEAFRSTAGSGLPANSMCGWPGLYERLVTSKCWARRFGKTDLVRAINLLLKDVVFALNEVVLDHSNALDTLITETLGQYGIVSDLELDLTCELSPHVPLARSVGTARARRPRGPALDTRAP